MLATRGDNGYRMLGELPGSTGETKVELWERPSEEGGMLLELVEYSWGSGMGWYVQKRLTLDGAQAEALGRLLRPEQEAPAPRAPRRPLPPLEREENTIRLHFA